MALGRLAPFGVSLAMSRIIRVLGGAVSLGFMVVGAQLLWRYPNGDVVAGISLLLIGAYFAYYAKTGQSFTLRR